MESIFTSSLAIPGFTEFSPPYQNPLVIQLKSKCRVSKRKISSNLTNKIDRIKKLPLNSYGSRLCTVLRCSTAERCVEGEEDDISEVPRLLKQKAENVDGCCDKRKGNAIQCVVKPIVYALFCIAVGFSPIYSHRPAIAVSLASLVTWKEKGKVSEEDVVLKKKDHSYSNYTKRLLETVSGLLNSIEQVRNGNGDMRVVNSALKAVKSKKDELVDRIMNELHKKTRVMNKEKSKLVKQADSIESNAMSVRRECEKLVIKGETEGVSSLEDSIKVMEKEYSNLWDRIGEIEDKILRKETSALSFGVRELCFIERECEELVKRFKSEMRWKSLSSRPKSSPTKLSRLEIKEDLEIAQRKQLEQMVLPNVVEFENFGPLSSQDATDFALRVKQCLEDSKKLQRTLEDRIRRRMKKFGNEKRLILKTPEDEVVKGFPETELKWMFGDKEVISPKATELHLYHGWKKWREEAKADLKRSLLANAEFGKQYIAQREERILLDRDRVVSKTWYNEDKNKWEMDPMAVPYAVSKKLIENARIRHDWAAMYVALKGDDRDFYVDIKEYERLFEKFGGFDALYMKMLACGIPTAVHLMWIPFSELNIRQQFLLTVRVSHRILNGLWKSQTVSFAKDWIYERVKNVNDDIMIVIVSPILELIIPYPIRLRLRMAWPEENLQAVESTWYFAWQSKAEMNFKSRNTGDFKWFLWFAIRVYIYGYILLHLFRFMKRKIPRALGYGPVRRNPNMRKLRRIKGYFKFRSMTIKRKKKAGVDPIKTAFDAMKRVKNPPIPLKDFASVESMREEINEVVAFLQNPKAFQEMGASAPRGVLIVGERGTGKTSLALAIAAEAKVPVVNVKAQELEAGLWVGQSAANVRELFQTARELAPVIIFVEDFDLFAGVRGKFIHTKQQDHEAFINQLLVELDGFEKQDGVVLMATTRNVKQIDEALRRPGRMDRTFSLQSPTQTEREKILRTAAEETMDSELVDLVEWKKVAEKTAILRPMELKLVPVSLEGSAFRSKFMDADELMSYCSWFATFSDITPSWLRKSKVIKKMSKMLVNHLGLTLTKEDMQNVVDLMEPYSQITNGIELLSPPLDWTREIKFPHAVWAAGRGLIAVLIPNFDIVENLWLEPCSWQGIGCTKITKTRDGGAANAESRSYLEKKLVFCFGSYIASKMLLPFGEENFLSSSELTQAQEIATRMVIQYGWGPDDSPAIYYASNASTALSMGNNHEYEMAAKVEKIYDLAYEKAKEMLYKNRAVLEKIVEELLEFEILTAKDLVRVLNENNGIREKEPFFISNVVHTETLSRDYLDRDNPSEIALVGATV